MKSLLLIKGSHISLPSHTWSFVKFKLCNILILDGRVEE